MKLEFNRLELAGSFGDLGTLLPIAIGMILINGANPLGLFLTVGLFYILAGLYYGLTVPVQPMKVIGAYSIATGVAYPQIAASALWVFLFLMVIGLTGAANLIGRYTPKSVIRGVQASTGVLLTAEGVRFIVGISKYQTLQNAVEPFLSVQAIGPIPIGVVFGMIAGIITLLFLDSRRFPAGLLVIFFGLVIGLIFGKEGGLGSVSLGLNIPQILPAGMPTGQDFTLALLIMVLPQLPMTLGNAVIANEDLSRQYFGEYSGKVTPRALCVSMALANLGAFLVGGMPLCHGAGGLAAHYRFGARTAGSNLMIGALFVCLAIFLGPKALPLVSLLPMSVLGVLLLFSGSQLAMTIADIAGRKELFVSVTMVGITLATNLAVGFVVGFVLAYVLRSPRLNV